MTLSTVLSLILCGSILINLLVTIIFSLKPKDTQDDEFKDAVAQLLKNDELQKTDNRELQQSIASMLSKNNIEVTSFLAKNNESISSSLLNSQKLQTDAMKEFQISVLHDSNTYQKDMIKEMRDGITNIQVSTEQRFAKLQDDVNNKLDRSLNERLDQSFKSVSDQLGQLYKTVGELNTLGQGVTDLQKTLSNVKSRGTWGEAQLGRILEDTMPRSQYDMNVNIKKGSQEVVEYAVKIPDKDNPKKYIYLPIDSKMPTDIYSHIIDASEAGDPAAVKAAVKELEIRIKSEARTIRDKYISVPKTTDFAIMFLPTESLYAEVLRIPGLSEWCQAECKIIVSGPTTITALLNSLQVGFKYLTINRDTQQVLKTLGQVKSQYGKFAELISQAHTLNERSMKNLDELKDRADQINKRLDNVAITEEKEPQLVDEIQQDITQE